MQDALPDREPRGRGQEVDRPLEQAPRREASPPVITTTRSARGRARRRRGRPSASAFARTYETRNEPDDGRDREASATVVPRACEDERRLRAASRLRRHGRSSSRGRRRTASPCRSAARARRRGCRAPSRRRRARPEPVEEHLLRLSKTTTTAAIGRASTPADGEGVRRDAGAGEARDRAARERACAGRIALFTRLRRGVGASFIACMRARSWPRLIAILLCRDYGGSMGDRIPGME